MSVSIEGIEKVIEKLEDFEDVAKLKSAVGQAASIVAESAIKKAPKDSGALRRSIQTKVEASAGELRGIVYSNLEYAPFREYGTGLFAEKGGRSDVPWKYRDSKGKWHTTSGMHPHPYMRPALDENREEIKRKLREGIK